MPANGKATNGASRPRRRPNRRAEVGKDSSPKKRVAPRSLAQPSRRSKAGQGVQGSQPGPANQITSGNGNLPANTAVIEQSPRPYSPGITMRSKRVAEWKHLTKIGLLARAREQGLDLSIVEAEKQAEQAFDELRQRTNARELVKQFEKTAPSLECPRPSEVDEDVEIASVLRLPVIRWLSQYLLGKTNRRGFQAARAMVAAVFLRMGFARCRPEVAAVRKKLLRGHTLASWAHDYPGQGPGKSQFYASLKAMLGSKSATAAIHANIELVRQLAEATNAKGKPLHPMAGQIGIVDATLVEADVPQRSPQGNGSLREQHREILRGLGREKVRPVVYTNGRGNISRYTHGYKLMAVVDLGLNVPLCWRLVPADADERAETRKLLTVLFRLWPDCPMWALVGDALYDHSKAFAHDLLFKWGLVPVFPRAGDYAASLPYVGSEGVPQCSCGEMKLKDTDAFYTAKRRAKERIPRGQEAPRLDARLRWICPNQLCDPVTTRPFDDPRLYSYLPRGGSSAKAALRAALLLRRNQVESIFASLKHLGLGGTKQERPAWACDEGMDWLLSAGLLYLTARRAVHADGAYDAAHREAAELGLLAQPTTADPAPGPTELELARARRDRTGQLGDPEPPRTWSEERDLAWIEEGSEQEVLAA
jgi:hypothetical protein